MEGKWFVIVFMLASFLYRIYKKNNENQKDSHVNESDYQGNSSWGLNDLITQFEQKYGVNKDVSIHEQYNNRYEISTNDEEIPVEKLDVVNKEKYESETPNHHALPVDHDVVENKKCHYHVAKSFLENEEYDLEQMIISQTILDRPDFD